MAQILTDIEILDAKVANQEPQNIEVGATAEQLLPLIDVNQNLAAANRQLVEQVLPTLRGGLQTKEVEPADIEQVVTPDDGYLGLSSVKVRGDLVLQKLSVTENGVYVPNGKAKGFSVVTVNVPSYAIAPTGGGSLLSQKNIDDIDFSKTLSLNNFLFNAEYWDGNTGSCTIKWGDKTKHIMYWSRTFRGATIKKIESLNTSSGVDFTSMCSTMRRCEYICELDFGNARYVDSDCFGAILYSDLYYFGGCKDIGKSFITKQYFVYPKKIADEQLDNQIRMLWDCNNKPFSPVITFYEDVYNAMTDEQKQSIINKNWTITTRK